MSFFDPKTQGYIDKTLLTLNSWFGSSSTPSTPSTTPPPSSSGDIGSQKPPKKDKKSHFGLYVGIGVGVLVLGGIVYYVKKKK